MEGPFEGVPREKALILTELEDALQQGRVDTEVVPLLEAVNSLPDLVTTSSCAGRVQLISAPTLGDKLGSEVLGKWHGEVTAEQLASAYERWDGKGTLLLMAQPLLLHVRCRDLGSAVLLRNSAQASGLKFSTIRSLKLDQGGAPAEWGIVVECLGTERMEVPLTGLQKDAVLQCVGPWALHASMLMRRTKAHIGEMVLELGSASRPESGPDIPAPQG